MKIISSRKSIKERFKDFDFEWGDLYPPETVTNNKVTVLKPFNFTVKSAVDYSSEKVLKHYFYYTIL